MTQFKEIKISSIFNLLVKTNTSFFTRSFIDANKWDIPVYSASKDRLIVWYGYIRDNIDEVRYFTDCLTWNIDWSIGKAFYREWRFSLSEKVIPLVLINDFFWKIDLKYISFEIEVSALKEWFWFSKKAWKWRLWDLLLRIPILPNWEFDLGKQQEIAQKYEKLEKIKDRIRIMKENIEDSTISLENQYEWMEKNINDLFFIRQWDAFYTKKRILENNWIWDIPIYSSNTKEAGLLVWIDGNHIKEKDLYYQYCLTWSIDGYAGKLFVRNQDNLENKKDKQFYFTINNHCGILLPKIEWIFLPFIKILLQHKFFERAKGYWNNKLWNNQIDDIAIKIPILRNWEFDLEKQKGIAQKYEKIEKMKNDLIQELEYLESVKVEI
jgi:hypothetical protein